MVTWVKSPTVTSANGWYRMAKQSKSPWHWRLLTSLLCPFILYTHLSKFIIVDFHFCNLRHTQVFGWSIWMSDWVSEWLSGTCQGLARMPGIAKEIVEGVDDQRQASTLWCAPRRALSRTCSEARTRHSRVGWPPHMHTTNVWTVSNSEFSNFHPQRYVADTRTPTF